MERIEQSDVSSPRENKDLQPKDSLSPWFEIYQINADTFALYAGAQSRQYLYAGEP